MKSGIKRIVIVMGSKSDEPVMKAASDTLDEFKIDHETKILSAHRMPNKTRDFAKNAESNGVEIIIAGAGKAAHLPGVIASYTSIPVIGIPIKTNDLQGMDSLLSIVQMPPGVPVATVAINGAKNAALLAIQILALKYPGIKKQYTGFKKNLESGK
jgi:5-(carboxyamino)imidazole ribonucleotide mutase